MLNREIVWKTYSPENVASLLMQRKTVLISLYANWDTSTVMHEQIALSNPKMGRFLSDYNTTTLRADATHADPIVKKLMNDLQIETVPAFIIYSPKYPQSPIILQGLTSEEQLRQSIAHAS